MKPASNSRTITVANALAPVRSWTWLGLLALVPFLATCGGGDGPTDPPGPVPGTASIFLSGAGSVGGLVFEVEGPIGEVLAILQQQSELEVALIGLGAGTLADYSRPGDTFTFFEIDPAVVEIATNPDLFTYVSDAEGAIEFFVGDGRVMLERSSNLYDAILMDAFSSDAIPAHLVTREAVNGYLEHLRADGLLVFHISNRHIDIEPVLGRLADDAGLVARSRFHTPSEAALTEGAASS